MTTISTYFYQGCPVCGRSLRIPVQYFGRRMSCSHCGGEFEAVAEQAKSGEASVPGHAPHFSMDACVDQAPATH